MPGMQPGRGAAGERRAVRVTGATGRRGFNSSGSGALRGPGGELRLGTRGLPPGRLRTEVPGGEQE